MITQWNDEEHDCMQGCSLLAQVIYLRGIRRYMDYSTGFVGKGFSVCLSMSGLADVARFSPDWGSKKKAWTPSKEEVRAAIEELKRSGLIEDKGSSLKDGLIFFLPMATTHQSEKKRNPTGTPQEPHDSEHTEESSNDAAFARRNTTRNPTTGNKRNPTKQVTGNTSSSLHSEDVIAVFEHWKLVLNHGRARLDRKRGALIADRLKDGYTVDDLKAAIEGNSMSAFHQGKNEQGKVYDDLTLILRDGAKVDGFMAIKENPQPAGKHELRVTGTNAQRGNYAADSDPLQTQRRRKAERDNWAYEWAWGDGDTDQGKDDLQGNVIDLRAQVR